MKKIILLFCAINLFVSPAFALNLFDNKDETAIKNLLKSQVKYANKTNFNKFIKTYDETYINSDGFNLDTYSNIVKDIWSTYDNIKYDIQIKKINVKDNTASVELIETSDAKIKLSDVYSGELKSVADSIYYIKKNNNGKWKVISDKVVDETTSMLYGTAKNLDVKLSVPNKIDANMDYTATLEFIPPYGTIAMASIASDLVEYPQKPTKEVFRAMPEDNILERIFTSNNQNLNEYVVASIGLTKSMISDMEIKIHLTGFGYVIKRVNVVPKKEKDNNE